MKNIKATYIKFINGLTKWFFVLFPTMIVSIFLGANLLDSYTTSKYIAHEMINRIPFALGLCYILTFVVSFFLFVILNRYMKIFVLMDDKNDDKRHYPQKVYCIIGVFLFLVSIPTFYILDQQYELKNTQLITSELTRLHDSIKNKKCIKTRNIGSIYDCITEVNKIPGEVTYVKDIKDKVTNLPLKNIITYNGYYYGPFCRSLIDGYSNIEFKKNFSRIIINSQIIDDKTIDEDICLGNKGVIPAGTIAFEF